MKRKRKDKITGIGYCGRWVEGELGWCMPMFVSGGRYAEYPYVQDWNENARLERVKITVESYPDKRGRKVYRILRRGTYASATPPFKKVFDGED